ncbi:Uncharacterised protein [Mycobacteroides abscessus]|nr:Uncharacterised protein [Mycobacteroides abscessus]SKW06782.1 Uncharacterised protein [Mycobacteroides abscessus subsp. abscessus]SLC76169.1 Uncharacterised protein [Mycobacteroides abscessus subsp. massiliense]
MRLRSVYEMSTEGGQFNTANHLGGLGSRLCVLPADTADPQHRPVRLHSQGAGQDIEQRDLACHVHGRGLLRILGAVARLDNGGAALSDGAQQCAQRPDLVRTDQRGQLAEFGTHPLQMYMVLPDRLLHSASGIEQQ